VTLTSMELRWARAAMGAIFPPGGGGTIPVGAGHLDVDGFLVALVGELPLRAGLGIRAAIWMCALAPLWVLRRPKLLADLDAEPRLRVVTALFQSSSYVVRQLVLLLKVFGALLFASAPAVRAAMFPAPASSGRRLAAPPRRPGDAHARDVA